MKCTKCGNELQEDQKFCSICGTKIEREKRCPSCGEILEEGQRFCKNCGYRIENEIKLQNQGPQVRRLKESSPENLGKKWLIGGGIVVLSILAIAFWMRSNSKPKTIGNEQQYFVEEDSADDEINNFIDAYGFDISETIDKDVFREKAITPSFRDLRKDWEKYKGKMIKVDGLILGKFIPEEYMEGITELGIDGNEWNELLNQCYAYVCQNDDLDTPGSYAVFSNDSSAYRNDWYTIYGYPVGVNSDGDVIIWAGFLEEKEEIDWDDTFPQEPLSNRETRAGLQKQTETSFYENWIGDYVDEDGQMISITYADDSEVQLTYTGYSEEGWYTDTQTLPYKNPEKTQVSSAYYFEGTLIEETTYTLTGTGIAVIVQPSGGWKEGIYIRQ